MDKDICYDMKRVSQIEKKPYFYFFLDPRLWDIKEIEGQAIYQIKDAAMSLW